MATRQFRTAGTSALKPLPVPPTARVEGLAGNCIFRTDAPETPPPFTPSQIEFVSQALAELKAGDALLDIGAGGGLLSVAAAMSGARVFAMEPDPAARARLRENLRLNDVKNSEVLAWSASDTKGYLAYCSPTTPAEVQRIVITTNTIDDAVNRSQIAPPTVVCLRAGCDAGKAIRGMGDLLKSARRPRAVILEQRELPQIVAEMLLAAGYVSAPDRVGCRVFRHGS